jgi:MFS family permease
MTVPAAIALTEGGVVGVIADKIYQVDPLVLAVIAAAPMFANVTSFLFARLAHGRRKVPLIARLQAGVLLLVGTVALAPAGKTGAALLVGCAVLARILLAGIVTLRSIVFSLNYQRALRASITARLWLVATATMISSTLLGSALLDHDPGVFRFLYACAALIATVGVASYSRVPLIGEAEHLSLERGRAGGPVEGNGPLSGWSILREDPLYARYLSWQFVLGVSNMMMEPALIYLISHQLNAGFLVSTGLLVGVPLMLASLTLPLWAAYMDRVHIARFRTRQSLLWILSQALTFVGALKGSLVWIALGRIVLGVTRGGGGLAWQLGHNDFASQQNLAAYMGLHVTLTGVRGLFAPFLGMLLYLGWSAQALPWGGIGLPGFQGIGSAVFLISCALSSSAALGFLALWRRVSSQQ